MTDPAPDNSQPPRRVRSFVRREGRMTTAQREALEALWPTYGLTADQGMLDLPACFGRIAPQELEIGFGNGTALASLAATHPDRDFLGIEVHRPGVGHLLQALHAQGSHNVRVIAADAVHVLEHCLPDSTLDVVRIYFSDPWPKKRHHKRRLIQPPFVELLAKKLKPGGELHLATDWEDYAMQMREVLESQAVFENMAGPGEFSLRPEARPLTKFERRGQRLGHGVWDLIYRRLDRKPPSAGLPGFKRT